MGLVAYMGACILIAMWVLYIAANMKDSDDTWK